MGRVYYCTFCLILWEGEVKGRFGYWVYRLFVVRGLFEFADSLNEEEIGEILTVRPECAHNFVFLRWKTCLGLGHCRCCAVI